VFHKSKRAWCRRFRRSIDACDGRLDTQVISGSNYMWEVYQDPKIFNLEAVHRFTTLCAILISSPHKKVARYNKDGTVSQAHILIEAMKNHLSSTAHSPKVFHCPLYFAGVEDDRKFSQLMRYFSTLSGLMQHLESGACQGGRATFRTTVEYIEHNVGRWDCGSCDC